MEFALAVIGRMKAGPERQLYDRYIARIEKAGRSVALGPVRLAEFAEARGDTDDLRRDAEAAQLLAATANSGKHICLDERGKAMSSTAFADLIARWRDDGIAETAFLIGGPDGHGEAARAGADLVLSFGPMTIPHQLVRVLLAEQLYRAVTILSGHPYHRE